MFFQGLLTKNKCLICVIAIVLEVVEISCAAYYDLDYMLICYLGLNFIISIYLGLERSVVELGSVISRVSSDL